MAAYSSSILLVICCFMLVNVVFIHDCRAEEEENSAYHESESRPRVTTSEERRIDTDGTFNSIPDSAMERLGKDNRASFENREVDVLKAIGKKRNKILRARLNQKPAMKYKSLESVKAA